MTAPSLFGIGSGEWTIINGFANWFAAAGSLAAVGVALYLASKSSKPTAKLTVEHRVSIGGFNSRPPYPKFVVFRVVNTGDRPIRIVGIGWKVGILRKHFSVQMHDQAISSGMPLNLSHGQDGSWYVPLNLPDRPWALSFAEKMILPHGRLSLLTLRGQAYTSVGHVFNAKPDENLIECLREACVNLRAK